MERAWWFLRSQLEKGNYHDQGIIEQFFFTKPTPGTGLGSNSRFEIVALPGWFPRSAWELPFDAPRPTICVLRRVKPNSWGLAQDAERPDKRYHAEAISVALGEAIHETRLGKTDA